MYLGRVVEYGETDDVIAHPFHPYTRVLISHCADVDPDQVRSGLPIEGEPPTPINPGPGCYFEPRCFKACPGCKNAYPGRVELGNGHYAYWFLHAGRLKNGIDRQAPVRNTTII